MTKSPALALLIIGSAVVTACTERGDDGASPPPGVAIDHGSDTSGTIDPRAVNLGLVVSLTGPDATWGESTKRAADLAVEQINALGGLGGKVVRLVVEDDESDPARARAHVEALAARGVKVGIGPISSASALAVVDLVRRGDVLYVSPTASTIALDPVPDGDADAGASGADDALRVLVRTRTSDRCVASAIALHATEVVDDRRRCEWIGVVSEEGAELGGFADALVERAARLGHRAHDVARVDLAADATEERIASAADELARAAAAAGTTRRCQVVLLGPRTAAPYGRAFAAARSRARLGASFVTLAAGRAVREPSFLAHARHRDDPSGGEAGAPGAVDGWRIVGVDTQPDSAPYRAFAARHAVKFPGGRLDVASAPAYDATLLLALAARRTGTGAVVAEVARHLFEISSGRIATSPDQLVTLVQRAVDGEDIDYVGASGPVDLSRRDGTTENGIAVWTVADGTLGPMIARFEPAALLP